MFALAILSVIMGMVSMGFWIYEGAEAYNYIFTQLPAEAPKPPTDKGIFTVFIYMSYACKIIIHGFKIFKVVPMSIPLMVDMLVTFGMTTAFGLTTLLGTLLALSASNVLSFVLFISILRKRRQ